MTAYNFYLLQVVGDCIGQMIVNDVYESPKKMIGNLALRERLLVQKINHQV